LLYAHDTLAGNSRWRWIPAPLSGASCNKICASFQRENTADDEDAVAAACAIAAILADSHNSKLLYNSIKRSILASVHSIIT